MTRCEAFARIIELAWKWQQPVQWEIGFTQATEWRRYREAAAGDWSAYRDSLKHNSVFCVEEFRRSAKLNDALAQAEHEYVIERHGELLELQNLVREWTPQLLHLVPSPNFFDPPPTDLASQLRDVKKLEGAIRHLRKRPSGHGGKASDDTTAKAEAAGQRGKPKGRRRGKRGRPPNVSREAAKTRRDWVARWKRWKEANPKIRNPMERFCKDETALGRPIDPPTLGRYVNWVTQTRTRKKTKRG